MIEGKLGRNAFSLNPIMITLWLVYKQAGLAFGDLASDIYSSQIHLVVVT
jgi:hypothetical protein